MSKDKKPDVEKPHTRKRRRKAGNAKAAEEPVMPSLGVNGKPSGYKNPPAKSVWTKGGPSPNPKGRPRDVSMQTILYQYGQKQIKMKRNGNEECVSIREAAATKCWEAALKGDLKALQIVLRNDEEKYREIEASRGKECPDAARLRLLAWLVLQGQDLPEALEIVLNEERDQIITSLRLGIDRDSTIIKDDESTDSDIDGSDTGLGEN